MKVLKTYTNHVKTIGFYLLYVYQFNYPYDCEAYRTSPCGAKGAYIVVRGEQMIQMSRLSACVALYCDPVPRPYVGTPLHSRIHHRHAASLGMRFGSCRYGVLLRWV